MSLLIFNELRAHLLDHEVPICYKKNSEVTTPIVDRKATMVTVPGTHCYYWGIRNPFWDINKYWNTTILGMPLCKRGLLYMLIELLKPAYKKSSREVLCVWYQVHTLTTKIHQNYQFLKFNYLLTPTFQKPVFLPVH